MKAALLTANGGPDKLVYGDAPDPKAGEGEIVVDIHAASVNAADYKVRLGSGYGGPLKFPYILGRDFSGVVSAVGPGASDFKVGDAVWGVTDRGIEGAYAEKIAIKEALVARKPDSLSHTEAAAIALIGLTAIWAIEDDVKLQKGETILIQGGAGGVAGFAIQLAKSIGATVYTTCSTGNVDYVKGLGADRVIDYTRDDFAKYMGDVTVAFDTVGGDIHEKTYRTLPAGGRMTFIAGNPATKTDRTDVQISRPAVTRDRDHLNRILALMASGAVKVPAITTYPLSQASEAHKVSEGRHLRGKLVLVVR